MSFLEACEVSVQVSRATLLDGVSLAADAGELVAVVGPNGAGKSTLLRILSGDLEPSSGEVHLGGKPLGHWSGRERARSRAVLRQSSDLSFALACEEVVLLGRAPHLEGAESSRDLSIASRAMETTDTLRLKVRSYPTLSGGEQQRVHAARAFAQIWEGPGPRSLLLDEPTASLDLAHQHALLGAVKRMVRDQLAVVAVLHDLNLAAQYADRVVVLSKGCVRAAGPPSEVLSAALIAEVFELDVLVVPHPELDCPLVITRGPSAASRSDSTPCSPSSRGSR